MRLQTIILINRAPFERLEINFGNENIAILSGINGAGKTTVLSYIVDAFYELAKKAFHNEFEDKRNKYYRISSNLYSINNTAVSLVYLRFIKDDGFIADYVDIRGKCSAKEYDEYVVLSGKIPFSELENAVKKRGVKKHWSIDDNAEIENIFSTNLLSYFPAYRYEAPSFLNDPFSINLQFKKDSLFSGYLPNPIEVTSDLPQIANWMMDIVLDNELYK